MQRKKNRISDTKMISTTTSTSLSLFYPNPSPNSTKSNPLPSFFRQSKQTHINFVAIHGRKPSGFFVSATKRRGKQDPGLLEMGGFEEEQEEDDEDEDEDGEMQMFLPFGKMKEWLEKKPRGFGEGKEYDTSIEDKLMEEFEQSRQAQAANINNLKNSSGKPNSKKDEQRLDALKVVTSGISVRVFNLPKKKNIQRDLKSAFDGVPGIINIVPAVFGNKKTRDPICKGFAFVNFKSDADATRFVQKFSRQSIMFGKIQKQIRCEMTDSDSTDSALEQPADKTFSATQLTVPGLEEDPASDFDMNDSPMDSWEGTTSDEYDDSDDMLETSKLEDISANLESVSVSDLNSGASMEPEMDSPTSDFKMNDSSMDSWEETTSDEDDISEDISENMESVSVSELNGGASVEPKTDSPTEAFCSKRLERIRELEKRLLAGGTGMKVAKAKQKKIAGGKEKKVAENKRKKVAEGKGKRVPKLDIPGSAKKLRIKEKAVLTSVFSKYGAKAALATKE